MEGINRFAHNLEQFIDFVTRYDINWVLKQHTEQNPYGMLKWIAEDGRIAQELVIFKNDLFDKFDRKSNSLEKVMREKLLPLLTRYFSWYDTNSMEHGNHPAWEWYKSMHGLMRRVESEIRIYFPEEPTSTKTNVRSRKSQGISCEDIDFSTLFISSSLYQKCMNILIERDLIQQGTNQWKYTGGGSKAYLVCILRDLYNKGYFDLKNPLTAEEIGEICKSYFHCPVSISTIRHAKMNDKQLEFIPLSSKLNG